MRDVTLTRTILDTQGNQTTVTKVIRVGSPMLIGMDAPLGSAWNGVVTDYPGIRYTRDFGKDGPDADTLTEPTPYGTDKFTNLPAGAVMHLSWKDDTALFQGWLDALPVLPADHPGFYVSPWHEPRDDVDAGTITAAYFRSQGEQLAQIIANHPKRGCIRGNGPILTRFDLDEKGVDPTVYGYAGMTFYGVDCYSQDTNVYYSTTKMFGTVFDKVTAAYPGIRLLVPEYGMVKTTTDSTGQGRADTIRQHITYLKSRGDVDAVAYFNATGSIPGVPFTSTSPEAAVWRDLQANQ